MTGLDLLKGELNGYKVRAGPDGLHLFDRRTGLHVLLEECVLPDTLWASMPRTVSIALTNACDLECEFCYAPKVPARLDLEPLCSWLSQLNSGGTLSVSFGGGEPTLYPYLVQVCEFAQAETGLAVSITTHAHRLTTRLADRLRGLLDFVRVSMDGVGATYESIRKRSYSDLLAKLPIVADIAEFGINFVVNRDTVSDLDAALEVAERFGAADLLLLPQQEVGTHVDSIDEQTSEQLRNWMATYRGQPRLVVGEAGVHLADAAYPLPLESAASSYAHIDAHGLLKSNSFAQTGIRLQDRPLRDAVSALARLKGIG